MTDHGDDPLTFRDDGDRAMDARLRTSAEAWLAAETDPPHEAFSDATIPRRSWMIPAAAAVAVIAVIASVTFTVRGTGSRPTPEAPPPTSSDHGEPGVVPWRDLPATHPNLPATTTPAWPSPAELAAARPCTAADIRLTGPGSAGAASGTVSFEATVYAVSSPCRLSAGYPGVTLLSNGRALAFPSTQTRNSQLPADPVLLKKGAPALLRIDISDHQCPALAFDELRVRLGALGETSGSVTFQSFCQPGEKQSPMLVEPIQSSHRRPSQIYSPFDSISAQGPQELVADLSSSARFEVTLTSRHDLPLVPCPDYAVSTGTGLRQAGLNCDGVPFIDGEGRPYLPAGVPVHFEMRAELRTPRYGKFSWTLLTPGGTVGFGGSVRMTSR